MDRVYDYESSVDESEYDELIHQEQMQHVCAEIKDRVEIENQYRRKLEVLKCIRGRVIEANQRVRKSSLLEELQTSVPRIEPEQKSKSWSAAFWSWFGF